MDEGKLFVISGPSGAGKGTICVGLMSDRRVTPPALSVSMTTRPPRPGEVDGVSYRFVSEDEFRSLIEGGGFLEYAEVFGRLYGTPREAVLEELRAGRDVILEIDVQGAAQVRRNYPESVLIFVLPPSWDDLRRRITKRGAETPAQIAKRLDEAKRELEQLDNYDYVIVNDDVNRAITDMQDIIAGRSSGLTREQANEIAASLKADAARA
jgi:guanylate kinase